MRRAILVILPLIVAATAAALWVWRNPAESTRQSPQSADEPAAAQRPGRSAEPTVALHLDTDATGAVAAGTPVFFTITLEQPGAAVDESWLSSVRFETSEGKAVAWSVRRLGDPHRLAASQIRFTRIRYGIDPETTAQISAGSHAIRAAALLGGVRIISDEVRFHVTARAEPTLSTGQSLQVGRFHLEAGEFDRAHAIALALVEAADDTDAYVLLGDAFVGLGRDREALSAYLEALASIKQSEMDESPDRILIAIERAHERLEASRR